MYTCKELLAVVTAGGINLTRYPVRRIGTNALALPFPSSSATIVISILLAACSAHASQQYQIFRVQHVPGTCCMVGARRKLCTIQLSGMAVVTAMAGGNRACILHVYTGTSSSGNNSSNLQGEHTTLPMSSTFTQALQPPHTGPGQCRQKAMRVFLTCAWCMFRLTTF